MTSMAISATFPLGVYTGHGPDGSAEPLPDFARVFSALVQAAAVGTQSTGDAEEPYTDTAGEVLDWLESHPPEALAVPDHLPVSDSRRRIAYRREGVFLKEDGAVKYKTTPRPLSDGTALSGALQWIWSDAPDRTLVLALDDLCADVPHLGETSSPVTLRVSEGLAPTHHRDSGAGFGTMPGELRQKLPATGRRAELDAAHAAARPRRRPSVAADKHTTSAHPSAASPSRDRLQTGVYRPVDAAPVDVPWTQVIAVPVARSSSLVPDEHLVQMCVAMHRAIVSHLGADASPAITGRYAPSEQPPANRVAIHLLPADAPASPFDDGLDRFLVMVPAGLAGRELSSLNRALGKVTRVVTRHHQLILDPRATQLLDGAEFWREPVDGAARNWEAAPGIVPERRIKPTSDVDDLTLATAWSLANVFRGLHPELAAGSPRERWAALSDRGVRVRGRAPVSYTHLRAHAT